MRLAISHETVYEYQPAVETAQHMAYLTPLNTPDQQLLSHRLEITPQPTQTSATRDVFGNTRHFFALQVPHRRLRVVATSEVLTQPSNLPHNLIAWEAVRERFRYHAGATFDAANEFVFASSMAPHHSDFASYARPSFPPGQGLLLCALDLMHRIYRDFTYESLSTEVNTPALQALAQRKGVCQDFAHIFVACLRSMGLAARYVSGYLLTAAAPGTVKLRGSDASHAWASVYLPAQSATATTPAFEASWVDLDPTNDRAGWPSPGEDYVTLAIGRDFSDVSPMRGVIHGGASHVLTVGVTVEPVAPIEPPRRPAQGTGQSQTQGQGQSQDQLTSNTHPGLQSVQFDASSLKSNVQMSDWHFNRGDTDAR
ncbi:transglutaminase family protein [Rhodoferax sp. U2-2l]|uniref:transglutaminase family protein n=1 Tax=Rhodoferax sp. U2-2l TaxID=2884000 RepID=UPI001D0A57D1|nr:transglutaminase family protein [Rhodoferax sp. U2-2l]MCB8746556.1 transglutaminase family protein [Rhodoferax sp. U2-2l]